MQVLRGRLFVDVEPVSDVTDPRIELLPLPGSHASPPRYDPIVTSTCACCVDSEDWLKTFQALEAMKTAAQVERAIADRSMTSARALLGGDHV